MYLFESQGWIGVNDALGKHPFTIQVDQRIERNPSLSDPICGLTELHVFFVHLELRKFHRRTRAGAGKYRENNSARTTMMDNDPI
jgi:hypothetical protein